MVHTSVKQKESRDKTINFICLLLFVKQTWIIVFFNCRIEPDTTNQVIKTYDLFFFFSSTEYSLICFKNFIKMGKYHNLI